MLVHGRMGRADLRLNRRRQWIRIIRRTIQSVVNQCARGGEFISSFILTCPNHLHKSTIFYYSHTTLGPFKLSIFTTYNIGQQRLFIEIYRSVGKRQLSNVDDHMGHVPSTISLPSTTQQHDDLNRSSKCSYCT